MLMTLKDIADLHRCSMRHARDVIVKLPGFPDEAPTSTPRRRLWVHAGCRCLVHRRLDFYNPGTFTHASGWCNWQHSGLQNRWSGFESLAGCHA